MADTSKIRRALISVSDKTGIIEFARELSNLGVEIISTGGTARAIAENGVAVREVSEVTGFPEMMDGRVKTLHPKIHGALLGLRDNPEHVQAMQTHGIEPIDLVVINLYPFEDTIAREDVRFAEAIEQIDIGGPAMIRSAAKNFESVAVVTDARLYDEVLTELGANNGALSLETRQRFATLAFLRTSHYDAVISSYLESQLSEDDLGFIGDFHPYGSSISGLQFAEYVDDDFDDADVDGDDDEFDDDELDAEISDADDFENNGQPESQPLFADDDFVELAKISDLRYGENPHQPAALYEAASAGGVAGGELLGGKEMSFNNYVDADAAWKLVADYDELACAIIKHTNPSGVGLGASLETAYRRALATDPVSAFGGIVAFNRECDEQAARVVTEIFTEVVVAPAFSDEALTILREKKNLRILRVDQSDGITDFEYKQISGGFLVQTPDTLRLTVQDLKTVTNREPSDAEVRALLFAWTACKHVKSNAIVFANDVQTVGVGAGQMNRVDSVRIAAMRAARTELDLLGTVLASDAFFPFRDGIDEAAKSGITAIIQPGGSVRDEETITAANEHNLAMVFTNVRHFKH